jgi:hypothetical protein
MESPAGYIYDANALDTSRSVQDALWLIPKRESCTQHILNRMVLRCSLSHWRRASRSGLRVQVQTLSRSLMKAVTSSNYKL